jgi:ribose transport system substrate-binding protein
MKGKKGFLISELILVGLTVFFLAKLMWGNSAPKMKEVAVILEDSENEKWTALKGGLKAGASEAGIRLNFISTGSFESAEDETSIVKETLAEGTNGLLVWPLNGEAEKEIRTLARRTPLAFLGNGHTKKVRTTQNDSRENGKQLAGMILTDYSSNLSEKHLGVLWSNPADQSEKEFFQGLKEGLKGSGVTFSWELGSASDEEVTSKISEFRNRTEIIVALDDRQIELSTQMKKNGDLNRAVLYGFGRGMNAVYQLDEGNLQGLVFPNDFDMGYEAARSFTAFSKVSLLEESNHKIPVRLLRMRDLMKKENQDMLYIISHNL